MERKKIFITAKDMQRLRDLIQGGLNLNDNQRHYLTRLAQELDNSEVVDSKDIPNHVVTMNSKVKFRDLDTDEICVYNLVYPSFANPDQNKISILAPVGMALLGYGVGDVIEWPVPAGMRRFKIEEVLYQPEAAGDDY
ncbi:MAG: nucleoside diphosphate kinase regulator [Candidatus Omnitrophica bacterium]|nr:nucleoside diphosphate kinase regulator [Candidatus Omnitrophota bacterium]MDD5670740.1 nucleoside diphosphate kinase regulator [Candidatus Omnitrophota bacterium]